VNKFTTRIGLFALTFLGIVFLPWWISVLFLAYFVASIPIYAEVIFFGFLYDVLYAPRFPMPYTGLIVAVVTLALVSIIKTRIRT